MASFLLELFSEEIPARMQANAEKHLADTLCGELQKAGVLADSRLIDSYSSPRRLAVLCADVLAIQPDVTIEKKGPKTSAPQAAIDGFAKSLNLPLGEGRGEGGVLIEKRMVGKDETYFAVIQQKGQPTASLLKGMIEKILAEFPWPKSMRWGSGETRWVRPLHSILCIFDGHVIPVEFAGVTASNVTCGHRFLAPQAIVVTNPAEYEDKLKAAFVLADRDGRKGVIALQASDAAAKHGLVVKQDPGLLEEVTGLVEWPTVLVGSIDAAYMDLPPEVLISEMRAHQKYFALHTKEGVFSDKFLITSNMVTDDEGKAIIAGNERVLRARLADGRFFFDQDRKKPLSEWAESLKGVTFHAKIGTVAQKVERICYLAKLLADDVKDVDDGAALRAAELCKADLVTGMVGEFPELQGIMGRYYALQQKEDTAVADAIRDHYLPLGPDSPVPTAPVSACVALADKLDTLISMFAVGEKPTGSKDPFALRRSALGIIRILTENKLRISLQEYIDHAIAKLAHMELIGKEYLVRKAPEGIKLNQEIISFFSDRLKVMLKDKGIRHDVISAVMANGDDDLVRVVARAEALQAFLATEDGANLLAGYRRAGNIVAAEEKKDKIKYQAFTLSELNALAVSEPDEQRLQRELITLHTDIQGPLNKEDYAAAMQILAKLRPAIDGFFTNILVNVEDKTTRLARLRLLAAIREGINDFADFSQIEG